MDDRSPIYTLAEARDLLPIVRGILLQLAVERRRHDDLHEVVLEADDRTMAGVREGIAALLTHLEELGVQLRDVDQGLVDIPTDRNGSAAWFCWQLADPDISHWHTTREGFANRRRL